MPKLSTIMYRLNPFRAHRLRNARKEKKADQERIHEDIRRGKSLLEMIDNNMMRSGSTRKQRKQFWKEFIECQNVRSHVYSTIEKAFEGESRYKKK